MKKFFDNKLNTVLTVILGVLILALLGHSVISALTPQTKKIFFRPHPAKKGPRRIYF